MRMGSLCSGIGLMELGLEWAGVGETAWQVEIDPGCRAVLARHWPEATRHEDIRLVGEATLAPVDLICGGFPCQDISSGGKRAGLAGARSRLWYEFARIVGEMRPRWVVVENVASNATAWVDVIRGDLERQGYASLPIPLAAFNVGAPYRRRRVFVVAHIDSMQLRDQPWGRVGPHWTGAPIAANDGQANAACALRARREGTGGRQLHSQQPPADHWRTPQPDMVRVVSGSTRRVDAAGARARVAALGNANPPQLTEVIGHVILQLEAAC